MAEYETVVRGGMVVGPDGRGVADIAIADGRIVALGEGLAAGATELDAAGKLVLPGGVDPHCHIAQISGDGVAMADDFESATAAAAHGGTTTVISFAAQAKGGSLKAVVEDYAALAEAGARIDYAFHLIVSDARAEILDDELPALIQDGHRSIKIFTTYPGTILDDSAVLATLACAKRHGAYVCVHAENDAILAHAKAALQAEGRVAAAYHARSHPRAAEIEAIGRMIANSGYLDQPVMLFHVSTAEGAGLIRAARAAGVPVRGETCPHYLVFTEDDLDRPGNEGAKFVCSPPFRLEADQQALWQALAQGDLEVVSSDHAPFSFDARGKLVHGDAPAFYDTPNGMPGLQWRLPLMLDAALQGGRLSVEQVVRLCCTAPAEIYGLAGKGRLAVGLDADLVVWESGLELRLSDAMVQDRTGYCPYAGRSLSCWPGLVMSRGAVIVDQGRLSAAPGRGRWLARPNRVC